MARARSLSWRHAPHEPAVPRPRIHAPAHAGPSGAIALIGVILFCTFWRLPTLGDPPWLNDEGVYATVGRAIVQGEALYRQIWENKPPAIYLLYGAVQALAGAAHVLVGVRVVALLAAIAIQLAVYRLGSMLRGTAPALLAVALLGLLVDLPLLDGTTANAEIFMAACTSSAMALIWRGMSRQEGRGGACRFVLAGILCGVAVLFKLVGVMDLLAALGIIAVWRAPGTAERRVSAALLLLAGVALPLIAVSAWLGSRGLLSIAFYATVTYNRGYVATGQTLHGPLIELGALVVPVLLVAGAVWRVGGLRLRGDLRLRSHGSVTPGTRLRVSAGPRGRGRGDRRTGSGGEYTPPVVGSDERPGAEGVAGRDQPSRRAAGSEDVATRPTPGVAVTWWLGLALIGSLASGRFYLHYFLQAVPPFALAVAMLLHTLAARRAMHTERRAADGVTSARSGVAQVDGSRPTLRVMASRCARGDRALWRGLAALLIVWTCVIPVLAWVAIHDEPAHAAPGSDLVGYYGHVWQRLTGALTPTAFGNALDPRVERNVAVAAYLRDHPLAPRRLYVWGNAPWIYYLSGYEHAARFLSAYYNPPIPGGMAQVLASVRAQPPPYIVVIRPPTPTDVALRRFVRARYRPVWRYRNAVIYRRD